MAVQPQRATWPDERLDGLNEVIREGFTRTERDMRSLKAEIDLRFDRIDDRFDRVDERFDRRFDELSGQFHALQRVMIVGLIGLSGSILAAVVTALMKLG